MSSRHEKWRGGLSTFSTKKSAFVPLCECVSDAEAAASLPERLELTFCRAAPQLDSLPCFYLSATVTPAVAKNLIELGAFLQKSDRRKVAQMALPDGRHFSLCALYHTQVNESVTQCRLECRVQGLSVDLGTPAPELVRRCPSRPLAPAHLLARRAHFSRVATRAHLSSITAARSGLRHLLLPGGHIRRGARGGGGRWSRRRRRPRRQRCARRRDGGRLVRRRGRGR